MKTGSILSFFLVGVLLAGAVFALGETGASAKYESSDYAQVSTDPTSIGNIINKVKRGVVTVHPQSASAAVINVGAGGGSGFIISKEGHFMTNVHVLEGSAFAAIVLWDGTTYRGDLIAVDPGIDIAIGILVDCPPEKIYPVALGDSDIVFPGEFAMAMGNPGDRGALNVDPSEPVGSFLLAQSATVRVVAGKDNSLRFPLQLYRRYGNNASGGLGDQYGTNFTYAIRMQTAIAGGNSGGPLFNLKGEVIGINFFGGSGMITQGSNWAIPISLAKEFFFSILRAEGDVPFIRHQDRPWIGLDICMPANVNTEEKYVEFVERYRPKDKIVIFGVRHDSPAWYAGFQVNDVIQQTDGKSFITPEDLRIYLMGKEIDEEVEFTIVRGEITSTIKVKTDVKRNYDAEFSV